MNDEKRVRGNLIYNMHISYCSINWSWYCFMFLMYTKIPGHLSSLNIKSRKKEPAVAALPSLVTLLAPDGGRSVNVKGWMVITPVPWALSLTFHLRSFTWEKRPPDSPAAKRAAPTTAPCTNRNILVLQICFCVLQRALTSHCSQ